MFAVGEYKRVPNAVGGRETVAPEHVALAVEDLIARTPARMTFGSFKTIFTQEPGVFIGYC